MRSFSLVLNVVLLAVAFSFAIVNATFAALVPPPATQSAKTTKPQSNRATRPQKSKKAKPGEVKVTLTTATDAQKADVKSWLSSHLEDGDYEIVEWGRLITAEIGGRSTRRGIQLKYRGINRSFPGLLHDSVFVLDPNGKIASEQGAAGFDFLIGIEAGAQRHQSKMQAKKRRAP